MTLTSTFPSSSLIVPQSTSNQPYNSWTSSSRASCIAWNMLKSVAMLNSSSKRTISLTKSGELHSKSGEGSRHLLTSMKTTRSSFSLISAARFSERTLCMISSMDSNSRERTKLSSQRRSKEDLFWQLMETTGLTVFRKSISQRIHYPR